MGGNALKACGLTPDRVDSATAIHVFNHLSQNWLMEHEDPLVLVPFPRWKTDHGDIAVLAPSTADVVRDTFPSGPSVTNDNVVSLAIELSGTGQVVQADFICYSKLTPMIRLFHSGADFGMLVGRMAAWHGFKLKPDGLYVRTHPAIAYDDLLLSDDPSTVLQVLGYPSKLPYCATQHGYWGFIASSPLFVPWAFTPTATTAENRSRDRKCPSAAAFQAWLGPQMGSPHGPYATKGSYTHALQVAYDLAPQLYSRITDIRDSIEFHKAAAPARKARARVDFLLGEGLLRKAFGSRKFSAEERRQRLAGLDRILPSYSDRINLLDSSGRELDPHAEAFYVGYLRARHPETP